MFKSISEILKMFTPHIRLFVLIILLISIVSVTYINSITKTPEELTQTISLQRQTLLQNSDYIFELTNKIDSLNELLLKSNQDCNDNAIKSNEIYTHKMIEQQKYVTKTIEEIEQLVKYKPNMYRIKSVGEDTISNIPDSDTEIPSPTNNEIMKRLKKIKNRLK